MKNISPIVRILSGLPGSGKSTIAVQMAKNFEHETGERAVVVSTDHFFLDVDGVYTFDPTKIADAHVDCFRRFHAAVNQDDGVVGLVVVDNTNLTAWEISPYRLAAQAARGGGCSVIDIVRVACDAEVAFARQTHGVPAHVFEMMVAQFRDEKLPGFWSVLNIDAAAGGV